MLDTRNHTVCTERGSYTAREGTLTLFLFYDDTIRYDRWMTR